MEWTGMYVYVWRRVCECLIVCVYVRTVTVYALLWFSCVEWNCDSHTYSFSFSLSLSFSLISLSLSLTHIHTCVLFRLCPAYNQVLSQQLLEYHGSLTAQDAIRDVMAIVQTGDLRVYVADLTSMHLYYAHAAADGASGPKVAYWWTVPAIGSSQRIQHLNDISYFKILLLYLRLIWDSRFGCFCFVLFDVVFQKRVNFYYQENVFVSMYQHNKCVFFGINVPIQYWFVNY